MALYPATPKPQGEGILARIGRFMQPNSAQEAGQMMVNPVGAVLPGMISESKLVPTLLKILREKGIDPARAEGVLMDAVTSGKIDPSQFKMVFGALKKVQGGSSGSAAARFQAGTKMLGADAPKVASSIAPAGASAGADIVTPQAAMQPVSEMVRRLRQKFQGGQ